MDIIFIYKEITLITSKSGHKICRFISVPNNTLPFFFFPFTSLLWYHKNKKVEKKYNHGVGGHEETNEKKKKYQY